MGDTLKKDIVLTTLQDYREFVDGSNGIAGWNLNGNLATWGELNVSVDEIDGAISALSTRTPIEAAAPDMYQALKRAQIFIVNGILTGAIRMPDDNCPDPAHLTPGIIAAAISKAEGK